MLHNSFREDACIQCGICKGLAQKVIQLVPQFNLADDEMKTELIIQDELFIANLRKAFGTTKRIEAVIDRLSELRKQTICKIDMLKLCED